MTANGFAMAVGVSERAAQKALLAASGGKPWRGHKLPVIALDGQKGGAGGKTWGLVPDMASPELRALLNLPETPASTALSTPPSTAVEPRIRTRPDERHFATAADRARILAPILAEPKGSAARAEAFRQAAARQHRCGDGWRQYSERTLRDWAKAEEKRGFAAFLPVARADRGKLRVRVARDWHKGCGLSPEVQERIAGRLERTARGLILKRRSDREVRRLCSNELMKLMREAGVDLPRARMERLCKLSRHWVRRFAEMKAVRDYRADHKRWSDEHEYRVQRTLTREPMEVLFGDVHHVDIDVEKWRDLSNPDMREAAKAAQKQGLVSLHVSIIGWMDGSSHYLWATPVICGPGQSITQRDVAGSLFDVLTCPHGGIPRQIVIDNGSEFGAIGEAIGRFASMAELGGLGVVKSRPYSPEGKGRLEGAFGILEHRFLSALPGYIAGDRMKSPTKSKGKRVDPYPHGPARLVEDIALAVEQYNGTAQDGQLGGLSPKAMLEAKATAAGWTAQVPDAETFDLVFSKEERRQVRKGGITIDNRTYSGPVLGELIGEKDVPFLVPMRDPEGPILHLRTDTESGAVVIHRLHHEAFDLNDRDGARHKGEMVKVQRAEMRRREVLADTQVDVQAMLSEGADLTPPQVNLPSTWSIRALDKAGVIGRTMTQEEAEAAEDARRRADMDEFLALAGPGSEGVSGWSR